MTSESKIALSRSEELFSEAQNYIPGGVNSAVRTFQGVDGAPIFYKKGVGAYLIDVDETPYIDYVNSWGPLILGHSHPNVIAAVHAAVDNGLSFGASTELEVQLAQKICESVPTIEKIRLVNSGTEATMTAIRLARGVTGRDKIIKFEGCYHGHSDSLLVKAGSGALTLGQPTSAGVPKDFVQNTLVATFNDLDSVKEIFEAHSADIAAVIVEPVAGNMSCVLPIHGFLKGLRELCDQYQSLLIFDEVITGFRVALGGAQEYFNVKPDITTLGKIIGGGMPVGAVGGKTEYMEQLSPNGPVYQAGTLSGNPITCAAGLATLNELTQAGIYPELERKTQQLLNGILDLAAQHDIPLTVNQIGSMFGLFFTEEKEIRCYQQVKQCNIEHYKRFFHGLLRQGVYFAPSAFETAFISSAHGDDEIENTLFSVEKIFQSFHDNIN